MTTCMAYPAIAGKLEIEALFMYMKISKPAVKYFDLFVFASEASL